MGIIMLFAIVLMSFAPIVLGFGVGVATGACVDKAAYSMKARKNYVQIQH